MSEESVWASNWFLTHGIDLRPEGLEPNSEADMLRLKTFTRRMLNYQPADPAHAPTRAWAYRITKAQSRGLPDFFLIEEGMPCVSARARAVLERFDLGDSRFFDIELMVYEGTTMPGGPYFYFNMTSVKPGAVLFDRSPVKRMTSGRWQPACYDTLSYENFWVNSSSFPGADVWGDPELIRSVFFSDALAKAIRHEKLTGMKLFPCAFDASAASRHLERLVNGSPRRHNRLAG
ncbi:MAG: DUF1629 domain-containing protein [Pseudomonadota bacterium]